MTAAHRAALDHVLSLIAGADWGAGLVLRGSMGMCAWAGSRAREPGDLDFVVLPQQGARPDRLDPYPYVDRFAVVQQWPEAAWGAAEYDMWMDGEEQFETRGLYPRVPPDGLHWEVAPEPSPPYGDPLELVRRRPEAAPGVTLDAGAAQVNGTWGYDYGGYDTAGSRVLIPWQAEGVRGGTVQIDFALDERLPEPPVWAVIPGVDGRAPSIIRTASRELSLAWKLFWLHTDGATRNRVRPKDLYDAVVLAEDERTRLSSRLLRTVFQRTDADGFRLDAITIRDFEWAAFLAEHPHVEGTSEDWLDRLGTALPTIPLRKTATS